MFSRSVLGWKHRECGLFRVFLGFFSPDCRGGICVVEVLVMATLSPACSGEFQKCRHKGQGAASRPQNKFSVFDVA